MAARGPKNGQQGREKCLPQDFLTLQSTLANKVFDPSTPSMRKVDDGEKETKEKEERENNVVYSCHLTSWLLTDWNADRSCQPANIYLTYFSKQTKPKKSKHTKPNLASQTSQSKSDKPNFQRKPAKWIKPYQAFQNKSTKD